MSEKQKQEITGKRPCDGLRVDLKRCLLQVGILAKLFQQSIRAIEVLWLASFAGVGDSHWGMWKVQKIIFGRVRRGSRAQTSVEGLICPPGCVSGPCFSRMFEVKFLEDLKANYCESFEMNVFLYQGSDFLEVLLQWPHEICRRCNFIFKEDPGGLNFIERWRFLL